MPVVTPTTIAGGTGELYIGDGLREVNLMGAPPSGIYLVELDIPVPVPENTYAKGVDSNGQRRIRSLGANPTGRILARIDQLDDNAAAFQSDVDNLEDIVASAHKRKGYIRYTWPEGRAITYDLESVSVSATPQDGLRLNMRIVEFELAFECLPWARLDPVEIFTDEVLQNPIDGIEVLGIDGHVNALGELTIVDEDGESADHIEYGLVQEGYNPDAPLRIDEDDLDLDGFAGTQSAPGAVINIDLSETPIACCGTGVQEHGGHQRVKITCTGAGDQTIGIWARLAWRVDGGGFSYGRWIRVPSTVDTFELGLAVLDLEDATTWEGQVEAFCESGSELFKIRNLLIVPAEVHGTVRLRAGNVVGTSYQVRTDFEDLTPGNLNGQTETVGGPWTATTDWDVIANGINDQSVEIVMPAVSGAEIALLDEVVGPMDAALTVMVEQPGVDGDLILAEDDVLAFGMACRYTDADNLVAVTLYMTLEDPITAVTPGPRGYLTVEAWVGGDIVLLKSAFISGVTTTEIARRLRLRIDGDGLWQAYYGGTRVLSGRSSDMAAGGTLSTGQMGLYAFNNSLTEATFTYDDLQALSSPVDHALWANRSLVINHEEARRADEAGTKFGRVLVDGDYLTIPPSTRNNLPSLLVVKRRQFDVDAGLPREGEDIPLTASLEVTPRVLVM